MRAEINLKAGFVDRSNVFIHVHESNKSGLSLKKK